MCKNTGLLIIPNQSEDDNFAGLSEWLIKLIRLNGLIKLEQPCSRSLTFYQ
jgi:hypothetical protein